MTGDIGWQRLSQRTDKRSYVGCKSLFLTPGGVCTDQMSVKLKKFLDLISTL